MPEAEIERFALALRDKWKVAEIAPGHCTGEPAFASLQRIFAEKYLYAGVGTVIKSPALAAWCFSFSPNRSSWMT